MKSLEPHVSSFVWIVVLENTVQHAFSRTLCGTVFTREGAMNRAPTKGNRASHW